MKYIVLAGSLTGKYGKTHKSGAVINEDQIHAEHLQELVDGKFITPAMEVVVSQDTLDMNPGMAEQGVKVGDKIYVPMHDDTGFTEEEKAAESAKADEALKAAQAARGEQVGEAIAGPMEAIEAKADGSVHTLEVPAADPVVAATEEKPARGKRQ